MSYAKAAKDAAKVAVTTGIVAASLNGPMPVTDQYRQHEKLRHQNVTTQVPNRTTPTTQGK